MADLTLKWCHFGFETKLDFFGYFSEVVRAMTFLIEAGLVMYWGTSRWSPFEIFESFSTSREFRLIGPTVEISEYHWFHREKVELFMAEIYNKIGVGLMTWSPISFGFSNSLGPEKQENIQLFEKLSIKNHKTTKVETVAIMQRAELMATGGQPTAIPVAPTTSVRITDGSGTPAGATANSTPPMDITALTQARIKALTAMADKMGCSLSQLSIAWCLRNSTSQSVIVSASSSEQLLDILGSLPVRFSNSHSSSLVINFSFQIVAKITHPINEDIEKILGNKPQRPPMISTLQTRWAGTGGVPPC